MSQEIQNNDNQEIDLSKISQKIGGFFDGILTSIFKGILFIKRNIIIIGILFVLGIALGYFLDKSMKSYENEIIISPNFGSGDYLYSKINLLNSKIEDRDTLFLKKLGIKNTNKISLIKVEPIVDIYKFIDGSPQNFELIKLLAEDGDLSKIVKDNMTSKNYPFHTILIKTSKKMDAEDLSLPLLNYLNDSNYFQTIQKVYLENIDLKMKANDSIINQIDSFLSNFKNTTSNGSKSSSLVYYNENTQLNEIIKTKDALINEQANHRLELVSFKQIVREISHVLNITNSDSVSGKLKFILPVLLIFIYIFLSYLKKLFSKQSLKYQNSN